MGADESIKRVLFEITATEEGDLELYFDQGLKPVMLLALWSALQLAQDEILTVLTEAAKRNK